MPAGTYILKSLSVVRHCCLEVWLSDQIHIREDSLVCEPWLVPDEPDMG